MSGYWAEEIIVVQIEFHNEHERFPSKNMGKYLLAWFGWEARLAGLNFNNDEILVKHTNLIKIH